MYCLLQLYSVDKKREIIYYAQYFLPQKKYIFKKKLFDKVETQYVQNASTGR